MYLYYNTKMEKIPITDGVVVLKKRDLAFHQASVKRTWDAIGMKAPDIKYLTVVQCNSDFLSSIRISNI